MVAQRRGDRRALGGSDELVVAMQVGAKFPSREIGSDVGVIRAWIDTAVGLGFAHLVAIDAVLGVDPEAHPDWARGYPSGTTTRRAYTIEHPFHEPLVLLGFMAACAPQVELATGVLVLPSRQTALVAKQAAEIDILCGGRLRLGVGVGWNWVEFRAMHTSFETRGRRIVEQVELMRELWSRDTVTHEGESEWVVGAGLSPQPLQRPIPLWLGGYSDGPLRRVGAIADGWVCGVNVDDLDRRLEIIRHAAEDAGRDPASIGIEGGVGIGYGGSLETMAANVDRWRAAGATHLTLDSMGAGLTGAEHVRILHELAAAGGLT